MIRFTVYSVLALASLVSGSALAQGQALPPVKVSLPPSPSFKGSDVPEKYPSGELSVFGLRKNKDKYMDKDVRVKAYLVEIYECPAELRKCNDALFEKKKAEKKKAMKKGGDALTAPINVDRGGCRPCDQPHFYVADAAGMKKEKSLLVADYPVKDWETGDPKPLEAKPGQQYVITGTFSINSMTGFAASNGLIIHKKMEGLDGKLYAEGNAVLPPEAQTIQLEGQAPQVVGWAAHQKGGDTGPKADKGVPGGKKK
jgi:hypothetical protein